MYGPESIGYWSRLKAPNCGSEHQHLVAGKRYRVVREFRDHDCDMHPVGESWVFMGYSFLPHDDGLSLFVSLDGKQEWHVRMQWRPEEQGVVLDNLSEYVAEEI
jgi:hypothetical protein